MNTDYIIRDYVPADFAEMAEMWKLTGLGNPARGDGPEVIEKTLKCGGKMLIMTQADTKRVIGCSWLTNDGRRIYLHHFGIHPDFQGRGLSKPLLAESLKFAKEMKMQIKLEVHRENTTAVNLYKKGGFNYLGDYHVYIVRDIEKI
ncbi:MAG: hypothetical protein A2W91_14200 [Bacteroidetes bacterium GWF2_38_335]|nr:MAG: hypothetical protein A2W91_14200 [Bacteroidetes bacterium GWF2_38_335]OFY79385.1 MAG: hypothetical protein A2281_16955 [Bacteroidetes bacterium RIFOXYA12_FULL_38_20]HBS85649.1 hypothetical protein [Bacteroidales bacterium]